MPFEESWNVDRTKQKAGPLSGIRVLDLSRLVAGNMLTLQLADFGAEVIRSKNRVAVTPATIGSDDGVPLHWKVYSRNKKSVALDNQDAGWRDCLCVGRGCAGFRSKAIALGFWKTGYRSGSFVVHGIPA